MSDRRLSASRRRRLSSPRMTLEQMESRTLLSASVVTFADYHSTNGTPAISASVQSAATGTPSLVSTIASSKIPTALALLANLSSSVSVKVANNGTGDTPTGSSVVVNVFLVNETDGSAPEILIGSSTSQTYANIKAVKGSKTVSVKVTVPTTLPAGSYLLVAEAVASGFSPSNSVDTASAKRITVSAASLALTNSVTSTTLPTSVSTATKPTTEKVKIVNSGTVATPKGSKVDVVVALRPTAGGSDIVLGSKTGLAFSGIKAGTGSATASIALKIPAGITLGAYTVVITVTPTNFTATSNNVVTGPAVTVVAPPVVSAASNLGQLTNTITVTSLIDTNTTSLPLGTGTTTTQHWNFTDSAGHTGTIFLTQNTGLLAKAADATINFFPNGLTAGSVVLKGTDASEAFVVGTQLTFGTSGSISCTTDSFTKKTCKVTRVH